MSRIGKLPVVFASGTKVEQKNGFIHFIGTKGEIKMSVPEEIELKLDNKQVLVVPKKQTKRTAALYGTLRANIKNAVFGVETGFTQELTIVGVGYRAAIAGSKLTLSLGYSHPIEYSLPKGVSASVKANTTVVLSSHDKQLLGQVAAEIRRMRPPEPYQGKGVRYADEKIIRKQGKTAGSK